jgi:hypothetical protein
MPKKNNPLEPENNEENRILSAKIKKRLDSGVTFYTTQRYYDEWAEYQRFWESDQWPEATAETRDYPRPVTNHFAEVIEMKTAGLCYEPPEHYVEPKKGYLKNEFEVNVQPLTENGEPFTISSSELLTNAMQQVALHNNFDQLVENYTRSGGLLGNGLLYSYWDNSVRGGGEGSFIGEIATMEIDITDFHVGDPTEPDIQKQPYCIVTERRPLIQVKEEYGRFGNSVDYLQPEPDNDKANKYDHEKIEQTETDYVNLIHYWEKRYVSEDAEIEGEKIVKRFPQIDYYVTCQDYILREDKNKYPKSNLYPFAGFVWYPRRKSFIGKPESKDIINNQKELNRLQGIALMGAYKTGLPDLRYKEGFVKTEDLHQGPGGNIIPDETPPGQGWGVDYLQPPTIASYIPLLKDSMAQGIKDTSGVHEAWSGKAPSAHLNASAIMALQEAAGVRIRGVQRRMHQGVRDLGRIWLGLMKEHYTEDRMYKIEGPDNVEGIAWFEVEKFSKMEYEVKATMSSASPYSKTVVASTLERMYELGAIDADLYIKMLPREVFPKVKELIELSEKRVEEQQQMAMQQQIQIVDEIVVQVIEKAREAGVEITPEALNEMRLMIQESAKEHNI